MTHSILHVVTNVDRYGSTSSKTGLWLSELAHPWAVFDAAGYKQTIVSPRGGFCPLEPRSLRFPMADTETKEWLNDPDAMARLDTTLSPADITSIDDFDAVYLAGGHAVMYDFTNDDGLHTLIRDAWESGKIVSSVCHGYCGLINARLSDGSALISGKKMTGFSWFEEILAGVSTKIPYNAERQAKDQGAHFAKSKLPFAPFVVADGNLVTGQNPASARGVAEKIVALLGS